MTVFIALLSEYVVDTIEVMLIKYLEKTNLILAMYSIDDKIAKLITGCIRFMGFVCELPQHNLATYSWQCS